MHRHLISEWSVGEHSCQLAIVEHSDTDMQIALSMINDLSHGTIEFWWGESAAFVQGVTELLITKHGELEMDMIIGIMLNNKEAIYFGWTPYGVGGCALLFNQGDERITVAETHAVEFFRWLRRSLQLLGRMVS